MFDTLDTKSLQFSACSPPGLLAVFVAFAELGVVALGVPWPLEAFVTG